MLNITLIITIETVRIPPADRCSALRNVMISMMSSFTRPGGNNPPLFRLLPNSFRFSYDHHLLKRATHFLSLSLFRGGEGGGVVGIENASARKRTSSLFFTAINCIRYPFGPFDRNDRFPATLSYTSTSNTSTGLVIGFNVQSASCQVNSNVRNNTEKNIRCSDWNFFKIHKFLKRLIAIRF